MSKEKEQYSKLIACIALAPVLADILEDINFSREMKMKATAIINQCRSFDKMIMTNIKKLDYESEEEYKKRRLLIYNEQINLQIKIRQFFNYNAIENK